MATERFANSARTTLQSAIDASTTTLSVIDSDPFPSIGNFRVRVDSELMLVTSVSGTIWTVTRGVESTMAATHSSGAPAVQVLTAGVMNTLAVLTADQAANTVLAGPVSGGAAPPTFRALATDDLPVVAPTKGGTGLTGYALGDILYSSAADTLAKLAGNTVAVRKFLRQAGTGSVPTVPAWDTLTPGDLPTFGAAGGTHAGGAVPDPGATSHSHFPFLLGDDGAWHTPSGTVIGTSYVTTSETTTSTTPVDLTTPQSITFTLDVATTVVIEAVASLANTTAAATNRLDIDIDGTDTRVGRMNCTTPGGLYTAPGAMTATMAAGTHTIKLQFSVSAGTGTFQDRFLKVTIK